MPGFISDSPLARGLIAIGDEAIDREDDAKLRDYYAADYVFHGPGGDYGSDGWGFEPLRARPSKSQAGALPGRQARR